ncbi:MAG: hypothetical protein IT287_07510 [Bdellovibrionaceae bacterium]|nr:hypothetical protein [Pseudobdellovibrionaceae bacterium]
MIFFINRFISFLPLVFSATLLISCSEKKSEAVPARMSDDKVVIAIDKELSALIADKEKMKQRLENSKASLEENALRPKIISYLRKEYFSYEKMDRHIDQQIAYYKIKKSLREKDVHERLSKITVKDLEKEMLAYEIELAANKPVFPWRALPEPEKTSENKEAGADTKSDDKKGAAKKDAKPAAGHH